jgi:hypothetical protein
MRVSIADMLTATAARKVKDFSGHDRSSTLGASEVGQCIRRMYFLKNGYTEDEGFTHGRGAMDRGDIIENHYWVPGIRGSLPEGVQLLMAGDEQRTLVEGFVSATPDGLLVGVERDCLAHLGIPDIGGDELVVECKTIDPRVSLDEEKAEHAFQTVMQLGLIRRHTNHRPNYALISYVNASFLDDVREFVVAYSDEVFEAGLARAKRVFSPTIDGRPVTPIDFEPEGKHQGGKPCGNCPFKSRCADVQVAFMPKEERRLEEHEMEALGRLVVTERKAHGEKEAAERNHEIAKEEIKEFLRAKGTRRAVGDGWSVGYSAVGGRRSYDHAAMEAAGIDLSLYEKAGTPGDRLTVTIRK